MNKFDRALHEICMLDKEAAGKGVLNTLNPAVKIVFTLIYLIAVMSVKITALNILILLFAYPAAVFSLSDIPLKKCFFRLRIAMGFITVMALSNLLFADALTDGIIRMSGVFLKGILGVVAVYILIATTKIEDICHCMRKIHIPEVIVTTLLLTYRYINVLLKEAKRMYECYSMMSTGIAGVRIKYAGAFLGNMLLRSVDKARAVYDSMNMLGYEWHLENRFGDSDK